MEVFALGGRKPDDDYLDSSYFAVRTVLASSMSEAASYLAHVGTAKETAPVLDKIEEEIGELREALASGDTAHAREEFGDVLFALVNLGRHLGLDSEDALRRTNDKFAHRFHKVEQALEQQGSSLEKASLDEMEELWQAAKAKP